MQECFDGLSTNGSKAPFTLSEVEGSLELVEARLSQSKARPELVEGSAAEPPRNSFEPASQRIRPGESLQAHMFSGSLAACAARADQKVLLVWIELARVFQQDTERNVS